jgi:Fe-S cluster assembly protein SufD
MKTEQQYIDLFTQAERMINRRSAGALNTQRAAALENFRRLGFPTSVIERYKYTDVSKFFEPDYSLDLRQLEMATDPYIAFGCDVAEIESFMYLMMNDSLFTEIGLLEPLPLPRGVIIDSLKKVARHRAELVNKYYGRLADTSDDGITAFNTTFAQDGLFIYVPKNVTLKYPIQIINVLSASVPFMVNRRILIILEEGAKACALMCDHVTNSANSLMTQVIEVFVGENAVFDLYELEEADKNATRISNLYIKQKASSNVLHNTITLHTGATRNSTRVLLVGKQAEVNLCGLAVEDKNQHVDNHTFIEHVTSDCTSNQLYKYVLDDDSTGAFAGTTRVRPGAQHTTARQTNSNLCTTNRTRMNTQPHLEIYADDVKCSHGATVGQLDENALLYMRSRGIDEKEARLFLKSAFVNEVIDTIRLEPLKEHLRELVKKRLQGQSTRCQKCRDYILYPPMF